MSPAKRSLKVAWIIVGAVAVVIAALVVFGVASNSSPTPTEEPVAEATQPAETQAPVEAATAEPESPSVAIQVDQALKTNFVVDSYQDTCGQEGLTWPCFIGEVTDAGDGKVLVWFAQNPEDPATTAKNILTLSCQAVPDLQGVIVADLNQAPLAEVTRAEGAGIC
ncbi:hypothetical protein [Pseudoclavibacter sp. RFBB5]|uniref:hypothetical protein n=1 Tax=Pseudoclavibacter sp. RFBB5 TaxID=2080574 RepID=UPI000CE804DA|nr:hypothetical protein [Pseudoclavibacter sp. RFBB5]PPG29657.1 hypothetical protein C5B97_11855 [Pseudoclavibacter sp. RFBB5]